MQQSLIILISVLLAISLAAQPPNDDCSDAIEIILNASGTASVNLDLTGATDEASDDCNQPGAWYKFTIGSTGAITIITTNSDGDCSNDDTEMHVYSGDNCGALTSLTGGSCLDNNNTDCNNHEQFTATAAPGTVIYVHITRRLSFHDLVFNVEFEEVTPLPNDACETATEVYGDEVGEAQILTDLEGATTGANEFCDASGIWYTFIVGESGEFTVTTTNSDGDCDNDDTEIHVFMGSCDALVELTDECQDEDNTSCENHETFSESQPPGTRIYVHVGRNGFDDDPVFNVEFIGAAPSPQIVPTLSEWSIIILGLLFLIFGVVGLRSDSLLSQMNKV